MPIVIPSILLITVVEHPEIDCDAGTIRSEKTGLLPADDTAFYVAIAPTVHFKAICDEIHAENIVPMECNAAEIDDHVAFLIKTPVISEKAKRLITAYGKNYHISWLRSYTFVIQNILSFVSHHFY